MTASNIGFLFANILAEHERHNYFKSKRLEWREENKETVSLQELFKVHSVSILLQELMKCRKQIEGIHFI